MELDYSVEPTLLQKWRPAFQNSRLLAFIGFFCLLFGWLGYTVFSEVVTDGIHDQGSYVSVNLKSLGNFPFDAQNGSLADIKKKFRDLDGKRVELIGKMYAGKNASSEVSKFEFVYDINKCCLGGPPLVHERVFVNVPGGATVQMTGYQMHAIGKLHVRLQRNSEGTIVSVYDMDLESLKPNS